MNTNITTNTTNGKKIFATFGTSNGWINAVNRITSQAHQLNYFDQVYSYTEKELSDSFKKDLGSFCYSNRGFGYWIWKPQVILQTLEKMNDGDILLYADCGCHLFKEGITRLNDYFDLANQHDLVTFQIQPTSHTEAKWTKRDLLELFPSVDPYSPQVLGGIHIMKKSSVTVQLVQDWFTFMKENFNLINDSPSKLSNYPEFREHRHDQSVFNMLVKSRKIGITLKDETYWGESLGGWDNYKYYPIHAKRDRN
jgi:hypothetical protein